MYDAAKLLLQRIEAAKKNPIKRSPLYSLDGKTPRLLVIKNNTLSLNDWLKRGPRSRILNAVRDSVTVVKLGLSKRNPNLILSETRTMDRSAKKVKIRYWKHRVLRLEPEKKFSESKIKAYCQCPDYLMVWEYVAARRGNTDLMFGNGEPPVERNPNMRMGACKHLLTLFKTIKQYEKNRRL